MRLNIMNPRDPLAVATILSIVLTAICGILAYVGVPAPPTWVSVAVGLSLGTATLAITTTK